MRRIWRAKRDYHYVFVANEVYHRPEFASVIALFVGCESHQQFVIFEQWIGHGRAVVFESDKSKKTIVNWLEHRKSVSELICPLARSVDSLFRQIHFAGFHHAYAAARRAHFLELVHYRLAHVDQEFGFILIRYLVIVLAQRHQIEYVI